ncbi:MAG TPA: hypothetical protein ENK82_04165 [Campylobacterales bacterium]|nr:hypothetical protein [Campylobacterales bacterium]HHS92517.1 hypothetical protein [Campylobacterales bacterium]
MNRKTILFILLFSFSFSSSLWAVEMGMKGTKVVESSIEHTLDEESIDELDMLFQTNFIVDTLSLATTLSSRYFLNVENHLRGLLKPPIV